MPRNNNEETALDRLAREFVETQRIMRANNNNALNILTGTGITGDFGNITVGGDVGWQRELAPDGDRVEQEAPPEPEVITDEEALLREYEILWNTGDFNGGLMPNNIYNIVTNRINGNYTSNPAVYDKVINYLANLIIRGPFSIQDIPVRMRNRVNIRKINLTSTTALTRIDANGDRWLESPPSHNENDGNFNFAEVDNSGVRTIEKIIEYAFMVKYHTLRWDEVPLEHLISVDTLVKTSRQERGGLCFGRDIRPSPIMQALLDMGLIILDNGNYYLTYNGRPLTPLNIITHGGNATLNTRPMWRGEETKISSTIFKKGDLVKGTFVDSYKYSVGFFMDDKTDVYNYVLVLINVPDESQVFKVENNFKYKLYRVRSTLIQKLDNTIENKYKYFPVKVINYTASAKLFGLKGLKSKMVGSSGIVKKFLKDFVCNKDGKARDCVSVNNGSSEGLKFLAEDVQLMLPDLSKYVLPTVKEAVEGCTLVVNSKPKHIKLQAGEEVTLVAFLKRDKYSKKIWGKNSKGRKKDLVSVRDSDDKVHVCLLENFKLKKMLIK